MYVAVRLSTRRRITNGVKQELVQATGACTHVWEKSLVVGDWRARLFFSCFGTYCNSTNAAFVRIVYAVSGRYLLLEIW